MTNGGLLCLSRRKWEDDINEYIRSFLGRIREKLQLVRRKPGILIAWLMFALVATVIGWSILFANLRKAHLAVEQRALFQASALARTHADRLARIIELLDQITLHVRMEWELAGGKLRLEKMKEAGLFPPTSRYYVTIVNREGAPITSSLKNFTPVFLGDRQYFNIQKNATADLLNISPPTFGQMSGINILHFSRRLTDTHGAFDGIVMVSVAMNLFTATYDRTVLGRNGLLGFVSDDHAIEVVRIGDSVIPPEMASISLVPDFSSPSGSALVNGATSFADKRGRYLGWQHVTGYPIIALTGLDEADTLLDYQTGREATIFYATWTTVALALLTIVAVLITIEMRWRKYRLRLTQATYRLATEEGSEGFYIVEPICDRHSRITDFKVIDCNQQGAEFFNLQQQELKGRTVSSFNVHPDVAVFTYSLMNAWSTGEYENELDVPKQSPFALRWAHLKIIRSGGYLAVRLRDISGPKAHVNELKRRGDEDVLTGLPNRHWVQGYLPEAINHAREANESLALLFIDLDGFKKVNDTSGHAAGDKLLQHAGERLREAVRPEDKVVRFGGDEFVLIIENIKHRMDATHVAERVQQAFEQPFRLSEGVHSVGTSIGIALFPTDDQEAASLLEKADIAMYSVKLNGKGGYQFYEAKFYTALRARLDKEAELRDAISRDEFVMYYQPRVDVATGATVSLEALIRWEHPSKGLLEPFDFIPLAEDTGLIVGIGELVIDKVCAQLACWSRQGTNLIPVSVNVSPRQFNNANVADLVVSALARHAVPAHLIELEITESSMVAEGAEILKTLAALQKRGIKILVDDFGTGYSSLSQLHRLNFDVLKVDQSFTAAIETSDEGQVFYTAIVTMAHALGMRVVAEGVETQTQMEILTSLHCDEVQGFYISKPLPASEKQAILPKWRFPTTK